MFTKVFIAAMFIRKEKLETAGLSVGSDSWINCDLWGPWILKKYALTLCDWCRGTSIVDSSVRKASCWVNAIKIKPLEIGICVCILLWAQRKLVKFGMLEPGDAVLDYFKKESNFKRQWLKKDNIVLIWAFFKAGDRKDERSLCRWDSITRTPYRL